MPIKNFIEVTTTKECIHNFPAAATDPKFATGEWDDVSFLAHPHRHILHFYVRVEVNHTDRDIEFIQFKRWIERQFDTGVLKADYKSMEMLANELLEAIHVNFPNLKSSEAVIKVFEDDENGAVLEYTP